MLLFSPPNQRRPLPPPGSLVSPASFSNGASASGSSTGGHVPSSVDLRATQNVSESTEIGVRGDKEESSEVVKLLGAGESTMSSAEVQQYVDQLIKTNKVMIFSKSYCHYSTMAKKVFEEMGQEFGLLELDETKDGNSMQCYLGQMTGAKTVPRVFVKGECIGGGTETKSLYQSGKLKSMLA